MNVKRHSQELSQRYDVDICYSHPQCQVEFVSFEDEEYESFEESQDEERDDHLKRANDGKETLQGEKELRLVIRDVLLHLIDVVAKEIGQGTTGSQGDMEDHPTSISSICDGLHRQGPASGNHSEKGWDFETYHSQGSVFAKS